MGNLQERRNIEEKEGGQPSRNNGETGPEPKQHRIDIVEINPRVKNWNRLVQKAKERIQSQSQWPRIPKVPQMLRGTQDFKKFYEPRVISLGPYHHGNPHLRPGEMIKPLYTQNSWLIVLWGWTCSCLRTNFLWSPQVDFEGTSLPVEEMIKEFITNTIRPEGSTSEIQLKEETKEPLISSTFANKQELGSQPEQEQEAEKKGESSSSSRGRDGGFCCPWKKGKQQGNWPSFRHIKELKAAGIHLQPSATSSLTDISFNSYFFYGYLKLPPIIVDDSTKPKFLNMVAYEMCPDAPDDYAVTSYVCFLYELIDQADDVKELRSKHILYNCLGSDEDVAKIFNEIGNDLVDPDAYKEVKTSIQKHYDKRVNTWIAEGLHEHFRSPWTIIAFIAAVLVLLFTGVSTYYALPGESSYRISDLLRSSR
ncbi:hypothetical protein AAG906_006272 [Vitis piasezkii]